MGILHAIRRLKKRCLPPASFKKLSGKKAIFLYAGDVPQNGLYEKFVGLSLTQANTQHIRHDVTEKLPLEDSCVDIYQAEDVLEHIDFSKVPAIIDEIHRVLKPGGKFRLSVPDYRCDILHERTLKTESGEFLFDPGGGGDLVNGVVVNGGHVWFPKYETVKDILEETKFRNVKFLHYYDEHGTGVTNPIDYTISHIKRTPDHDDRVQHPYRPMSIVVDCVK